MTRTDTTDERFAAALGEYQAALELGLPIDRPAFLARHPDLPDLDADLDALDALHRAGDDPDEPEPAASPEPTLADFELVREVGRGGMGVVFEARQRSLGRAVAVKVLTQAAALDDRARRRFLYEARAAALVEHPNVVPVYHVGEEHGVPFYVMPLVGGASLADPAAPLPPRNTPDFFAAVARLGADAARALAAAHEQGVIHRDVKPANLLLDPSGKVWVTDFGLAVAPFADGLTRTGGRPGTPRYMSPEQLAGARDRLDGRADVYSLGATLYELLAGCPAFAGSDELLLIQAVTQTAPPPPSRANPSVPPELETVVLKAMARDPDDRYPTARALADDLRRFVEHRPVLARRPGWVRHAAKWARRNRRPVAFVGVTLLAGLLVGLAASAVGNKRAYEAEKAARADAETNRRLALAAITDLGEASDEILSHAPGMQDRQLKFLLRSRDTLRPFAADPTLPVSLRRDAAWVHARLAEAFGRAGRADEALESSRALVELIEPLVALDPNNLELRLDASIAALDLLHRVWAHNDPAEARRFVVAGLEHAEAALRIEPRSARALERRAVHRCRLADLDEHLDGPPGASLPAYYAALDDYEDLRRRYPTGHPRTYMRLAEHWAATGGRHERRGEWGAAERAYAHAVSHDIHLEAVFLPKQPPDIRSGTVHARGALGWLLARRGRPEEAIALLRRCSDDIAEHHRLYPLTAFTRQDLVGYSSKWCCVARLLGRDADAATAAARVAAHFDNVRAGLRADACGVMWATLPPAHAPRTIGEALLADPKLKGSRALVLFRLDRFADAEAAADDSVAGLFVRSMCRARRGDTAAAKADFAAASAKLDALPLRDPELVLFQREAAAVGR